MPKPPDKPTFFLDECFGRFEVPGLLRQAGMNIELHADHFPTGCRDEDWLPTVGQRGWIVITKDSRFRYRPLERKAYTDAKAIVFVLRGKDMSGREIAEALIAAYRKMERIVRRYRRPMIATVSRSGSVTVKEGKPRYAKKSAQNRSDTTRR